MVISGKLQKATIGSAGYDLFADIVEPIILQPMGTVLVPTGVYLNLPTSTEAQVRSRSGMAVNHSVFVLNSPGTIDSDYHGEVKVILSNFSTKPYIIEPDARIAQLIFAPVLSLDGTDITLSNKDRNDSGFGSSGGY